MIAPRTIVIDQFLGKRSSFTGPLLADLRSLGCDVVADACFKGSQAEDIVHVDWCDRDAVAASRGGHRRLTIRLHSYELKYDWFRRVEWRNVDELIFVSAYQRRLFEREMPGARTPMRVLPAIEHVVALPFADRTEVGDVALVSRLEAEKGVALAFEIIRLLPGRRFHWFGKSDFYTAEYVAAHAPRNLELHGEIPQEELLRALADDRFTHLLHCSTREGFPVAVAEAMALGLRPVVHAFPGAADILPPEVLWTNVENAIRSLWSAPRTSAVYRDFIVAKARPRLSEVLMPAGLQSWTS